MSVAAFGGGVRVLGTGRGGKAREELLAGAALLRHVGKRARRGHKVQGLLRVLRVVGGKAG